MNSETKLVFELWDYFRDTMAAGKRVEAAMHMLRLFEEHGVEIDRHDLEGECEYLDEALHNTSEDDEDLSDELGLDFSEDY
jgi:hypothetical protein